MTLATVNLRPSRMGSRLTCALVGAVVSISGCSKPHSEIVSAPDVRLILEQLDENSSEDKQAQASRMVLQYGTNCLPGLFKEMDSFRWRTPIEEDEAVRRRAQRLSSAFWILGTNLTSAATVFAANIDTNKNFVLALDGFAAMGESGLPYLSLALTNSHAAIRLCGVNGLVKIGNMNPEAVPLLVSKLLSVIHDESPIVRSVVVSTLGTFCQEFSDCLNVMSNVATKDPDEVIRSHAITSIGRMSARNGAFDEPAKKVLKSIMEGDPNDLVRKNAKKVLLEMDKRVQSSNPTPPGIDVPPRKLY